MPCLFCHTGKMKPEFWLGENQWSVEENPYYIRVRSHTMLEQGFRTRLYPPDIVAQWVRDGGLCYRSRFIPWADVQEITWEPQVAREALEPVEE